MELAQRRRLVWLSAAFALLASGYMLGRVWDNTWAIIDDHEVLSWQGGRSHLPLGDVVAVLRTTEILDPQAMARFRPFYYGAKVAQAVLFGKHVGAWYVTFWLVFAASVLVTTYALIRYVARDGVERAVVLGGMVLVLGRTYWMDSFSRLGPSEPYAILGGSLFLYGLLGVLAAEQERARHHVLLVIGAIFAAGSKENMLFLLPVVAAIAAWRWRARSLSFRLWMVGCVLALAALAARVAWVVRESGADVYGNSADVSHRMELIVGFLSRPEALAAGGAGVAFAAWAFLVRRGGDDVRRSALRASGVLLGCTALAGLQYAFYAGKLPARSRYDYPYFALLDVAAIVAAIQLVRILRARASSGTLSARVPMAAGAAMAAAFVVAGLPVVIQTRADVRWLRREHKATDRRLTAALERAASAGATSVVLFAHRGLDYEPVMSVSRHLTARGVRLPIYLKIADDAEAGDTYESGLLAAMRHWSERGFERIRGLSSDVGPCLSLSFHGAGDPACAVSVDVWPTRSIEWSQER
jgi:hypothetical protein